MAADLEQCLRVGPKDLAVEALLFCGGAAWREVRSNIEPAIKSGLSVLLHVEPGTGKRRAAGSFHCRLRCSEGQLILFGCAATPGHAFERESMGCEPGSGTDEAKPGLVKTAKLVTLFLEETAEIASALKGKILVWRVNGFLVEGGWRPQVRACEGRLATVRMRYATHAAPPAGVGRGTLRRDLFNPIGGVCRRPSAARQGIPGIPQLWDFFTGNLARRLKRHAIHLTLDELRALENYVARVVILSDEEVIAQGLRRREVRTQISDGQADTKRRPHGNRWPARARSGITQALQAVGRNPGKTSGGLKRSWWSILYRLTNNGIVEGPTRRTRFHVLRNLPGLDGRHPGNPKRLPGRYVEGAPDGAIGGAGRTKGQTHYKPRFCK